MFYHYWRQWQENAGDGVLGQPMSQWIIDQDIEASEIWNIVTQELSVSFLIKASGDQVKNACLLWVLQQKANEELI